MAFPVFGCIHELTLGKKTFSVDAVKIVFLGINIWLAVTFTHKNNKNEAEILPSIEHFDSVNKML